MITKPITFTLDELCHLTHLNKRTVRFYIQEALVDRPKGSKRGAYYVPRHLEQLLEVVKWQNAGLTLGRIKDLLAHPEADTPLPPPRKRTAGEIEVWSHLLIREGVELHVDPKRADMTPEQVLALARGVMALAKQIKQKDRQQVKRQRS